MASRTLSTTRNRGQVDAGLDSMVRVPGGTFLMGSDHHYAEEAPAHRVTVDGFLLDRHPVTNAEFARFVAETGHVTVAETAPDPRDYPDALPEMLHAGSLVFAPPRGRVPLNDWSAWWAFVFDATWRTPLGPSSSIIGLDDHPVVHVAYGDAMSFAAWAGKDLPTEAEWEFAARGGFEATEYAWGDEFAPSGSYMANTWQGDFPYQNSCSDGWLRTSPVGTFPANGYGLHDMIGNVWEWTSDFWTDRHPSDAAKPCCVPRNPRVATAADSHDPCQPGCTIPRMVLKGGSHLCAPDYCMRYRPAARHPEPVDTSTSHVGFRCVIRSGAGAG